ncbi:MAG: NAD-dependent deacylase [Spirochaetes bacterium]|nr:NAD-dependent deacylase [Spirochaetota bacterium]
MERDIDQAVKAIVNAGYVIALTGAGISTESGIPDFRSAGGLWAKYNPAEYATIEAFRSDPEKVWRMLFDMVDITVSARYNAGHAALAELEKMDILRCVITQNIDNLHQEAGSENVIEYHGNVSRLECLYCGQDYDKNEFDAVTLIQNRIPPICKKCGEILKPAVILFGELIPEEATVRSLEAARKADAVLVIGTSAVVYPAANIPLVAKQNRAVIIEFNTETTALTNFATDIFIQGMAGQTLPEMVRRLKAAR